MFYCDLRVSDPDGLVIDERRALFQQGMPPIGKRFPLCDREIEVTGVMQAFPNRPLVLATTTSG
jgi:hypothetical protein